MNKEQILKECISIAVKNGFDIIDFMYQGTYDWEHEYNTENSKATTTRNFFAKEVNIVYGCDVRQKNLDETFSDWEYYQHLVCPSTQLLLNHEFCRKLFGEEKLGEYFDPRWEGIEVGGDYQSEYGGYDVMFIGESWKYHIQQLSVSTDRIKYLGEWLKTQK